MIEYKGRVFPQRAGQKQFKLFGRGFELFPPGPVSLWPWLPLALMAGLGTFIAVLIAGDYFLPGSLKTAIYIVALPVGLVFMLRPRLALWTLLILANFVIFLNRLAPSIPFGTALEALLLAAGLGTFLMAAIQRRLPHSNLPRVLKIGLIAYSFYYGLQIFNPNSPGLLNMFFGARWWILPVLMPWLVSIWFGEGRYIRQFFIIWMATAIIVMLDGFWQQGLLFGKYQFLAGEQVWLDENAFTHNLNGVIRIFGTLGSADAMGMFMVTGILIALTLLITKFLPVQAKAGLVAFIPMAILVMLWTMTRGAYVSLGIGLVVIAVLMRQRALLIITSLLAVLYLILLVSGVGRDNVYVARFFTITNVETDASYQVRQDIFDRSVNLVYENPIGFGTNSTGANGKRTLDAAGGDLSQSKVAGLATDNYYLRIGLENGWLGLIAFGFLLVCVYISIFQAYFKTKSRSARYLLTALIAVLVALTIGSWSNNYFQYPPLTQIFFMSLGFIGSLRDIKEEDLVLTRQPKKALN